jgi:hypothetical protein
VKERGIFDDIALSRARAARVHQNGKKIPGIALEATSTVAEAFAKTV